MRIGGCLRDDTGHWIFDYSQNKGRGSALEAKLTALMIGLDISIQHHHLRKGIIKTDSSIVINLLQHHSTNHHPLGNIIDFYRYLLSKLEAYLLIKESRYQNRCADGLAKKGRHGDFNLQIYDDTPDFIQQFYLSDKSQG